MNLSAIFTKALGRSEFFLRRNAPTILTGAGVAGFAATVAVTIHVSPKAVYKLSIISEDVAETKAKVSVPGFPPKEKGKELGKVYARSAFEIAKVYGPTLLLGSASIVCVISAHTMMLKRQASLLAAYTALSAAYEAYRKRVIEKMGPEEELKLYRDVKFAQGCDEEGEPCEIIDLSDVQPSAYSVFFDESSPNWKPTAEYNKFLLRAQQEYANHRLHTRGFLFLNEVLSELGIPLTQAGQIVGWRMPKDNCRQCKIYEENEGKRCPDCRGDGYVDFGMYDIFSEAARAFINGNEAVVLLDFNVDGPIIPGNVNLKAKV